MRRGARAAAAFAVAAGVLVLCAAPPALAAAPAAAAPACTKAAARQAVLSTGFARKVRGTLGASIFGPGQTVLELFSVAKPICADVTRDGVPEMVVRLRCCTVSSPSPWAIFQVGAKGGWALRYSRIRTISFRLRVDGNGDVEEKVPDYARSDPNCCPSRFRYARAHWTGTAFVTLRGQG